MLFFSTYIRRFASQLIKEIFVRDLAHWFMSSGGLKGGQSKQTLAADVLLKDYRLRLKDNTRSLRENFLEINRLAKVRWCFCLDFLYSYSYIVYRFAGIRIHDILHIKYSIELKLNMCDMTARVRRTLKRLF